MAAAVRAVLRDGPEVPMARIAAEAGVGVATLYRSFPDRSALTNELQVRSYGVVAHLLDEVLAANRTGLDGVRAFLEGAFALRGELVLPFHGAPNSSDPGVVAAALSVRDRVVVLVDRGHRDGTLRADLEGQTVVEFSALLIEGLPNAPRWDESAEALRAVFLTGIAGPNAPAPPDR